MTSNRFFYLSLAMAGCTAAAYAIGRYTRQINKKQHKEDLRSWEDDGGNLAPSEAPGDSASRGSHLNPVSNA